MDGQELSSGALEVEENVNSISLAALYETYLQLATSPAGGQFAIPLPAVTVLDSVFGTDAFAEGSCLSSTQTQNQLELEEDKQAAEHSCQCGKTFKRKGDLNRHKISSLQHSTRQYPCGICGKSYTRKATLKNHACRMPTAMSKPSPVV